MIEIICRENRQEEQEMHLPKNIRQVGSPQGRHKIYMEDYVYTYLRNQAGASKKCAAVLLGKSCVSRELRYTFISGAVECGQAVFQFDSIFLDESFWQYIKEQAQEYFPDTEIVGWFVAEQGEELAISPAVESAHRKYFAGRDKVLMLLDAEEDEELFYIYEQGYLQKREGYYIYYEKNIAMQEYMIRTKEHQQQLGSVLSKEEEPLWKSTESEEPLWRSPESEDVLEEKEEKEEKSPGTEENDPEIEADQPARNKIFVKSSLEEPVSEAERALQEYRHGILEKRGQKVESRNKKFLYTAASFFMMAFCIVGITTINNYRKMKEVEEVLYVMKGETSEEAEEGKDTAGLVVESVESGVTPLEGQDASENQDSAEVLPDGQQAAEQTGEQQAAVSGQTGEQQTAASGQTGEQQAAASGQTTEQQTAGQTTEQQTAATGQTAEPQYYTVQAGDTLESICLKIYQDKSMVATLCQANGIADGNQIKAGQTLVLP